LVHADTLDIGMANFTTSKNKGASHPDPRWGEIREVASARAAARM